MKYIILFLFIACAPPKPKTWVTNAALNTVEENDTIVSTINELNAHLGCEWARVSNVGTFNEIANNRTNELLLVFSCTKIYGEPCSGFELSGMYDDDIVIDHFNGSNRVYMLRLVLLHEIGHAFGLSHVTDGAQIMFGRVQSYEIWPTTIDEERWNFYINQLRKVGVSCGN